MEIHSKDWWDERAKKHKVSFGSAQTSAWSAVRRFRSISQWVGEHNSVADIGGGVGMLGRVIGPFKTYMVADLSDEALALSDADVKKQVKLPDDFSRLMDDCKEMDIDWIVFCALFMIPESLGDIKATEMMRKAFDVANVGVIGNFRDSSWPHEDYLCSNYCSDVLGDLDDLHPSVDRSFLPSEFMVMVRQPPRDWHTVGEAQERVK